jgi:sulfopyruvate decarboxylase subunit beta
MKRYDALNEIVKILIDELVVCNLGDPSRELYSIKDRLENFYMMGSMGLTSSIAFGLAISQPKRRVYCIDGDGSILMNLGSLSTIANNKPMNLIIIIIDNASYGSTGNQKTYTSNKTKLGVIAEGAGFESITVIDKVEDILPKLKVLGLGCHFILIKTIPGKFQTKNIPLHPEKIKTRFIKALSK